MDIIQELEKQELEGKKIPKIKSGDIVRIIQVYKEKDKERHSVFEGMVIAINSGSGTRRTITVRRVIDGVGVEKIVPLYLSNISKIEVLKSSKTRRAKLYYLRNLSGKKARLKEKGLDKDVLAMVALEEEDRAKGAQKEAGDKKGVTPLRSDSDQSSAGLTASPSAKSVKKAGKNDQTEEKAGK